MQVLGLCVFASNQQGLDLSLESYNNALFFLPQLLLPPQLPSRFFKTPAQDLVCGFGFLERQPEAAIFGAALGLGFGQSQLLLLYILLKGFDFLLFLLQLLFGLFGVLFAFLQSMRLLEFLDLQILALSSKSFDLLFVVIQIEAADLHFQVHNLLLQLLVVGCNKSELLFEFFAIVAQLLLSVLVFLVFQPICLVFFLQLLRLNFQLHALLKQLIPFRTLPLVNPLSQDSNFCQLEQITSNWVGFSLLEPGLGARRLFDVGISFHLMLEGRRDFWRAGGRDGRLDFRLLDVFGLVVRVEFMQALEDVRVFAFWSQLQTITRHHLTIILYHPAIDKNYYHCFHPSLGFEQSVEIDRQKQFLDFEARLVPAAQRFPQLGLSHHYNFCLGQLCHVLFLLVVTAFLLQADVQSGLHFAAGFGDLELDFCWVAFLDVAGFGGRTAQNYDLRLARLLKDGACIRDFQGSSEERAAAHTRYQQYNRCGNKRRKLGEQRKQEVRENSCRRAIFVIRNGNNFNENETIYGRQNG